MPVESTSVKDAGNIKEIKLTKGTCSMSVKEPNLPEKRAHLSEISENGHNEQQGQCAENIRVSDPGPSSPLLEKERTKMYAKKAKDWKDLAQRLLFSETKSSSTARQKRDHQSEFDYGTENCSLQKKTSSNSLKVNFRKETSATGSKGSMNSSKDYILFSPTRMAAAAAKKRSGFQQQKARHGNLSVLTPPPGLDLSSLCSSPTDAGTVVLHSTQLKWMTHPSQNSLRQVVNHNFSLHDAGVYEKHIFLLELINLHLSSLKIWVSFTVKTQRSKCYLV